ncbi:MAG: hypothetical protein M1818_000722 [Claussenomyces sp. TS43310]|nr:MAG: hypothetical protein M1818_000722 [Claussenomyces sp. TS43310]
MSSPEEPAATSLISLRGPTTTHSPSSTVPGFTPPSTAWLSKAWYVTHSTLPMWKKSRNVSITYKPLPPSSGSDAAPRLDDLVTYQGLSSDKIKRVEGIDTPAAPGAWNWRGSGWLKIASSHWEILGYGGEEGGDQWVVTYFAKTLFTPSGVDVYSSRKEGLSQLMIEAIKQSLKAVDAEEVKKLAGEIFVVKSDYY